MKELVAPYIQRMVRMRYCVPGDMSEKTLPAGLQTFAGIDDEFDKTKFVAHIPKLLKMDYSLCFDNSFAKFTATCSNT